MDLCVLLVNWVYWVGKAPTLHCSSVCNKNKKRKRKVKEKKQQRQHCILKAMIASLYYYVEVLTFVCMCQFEDHGQTVIHRGLVVAWGIDLRFSSKVDNTRSAFKTVKLRHLYFQMNAIQNVNTIWEACSYLKSRSSAHVIKKQISQKEAK